MADALQVGLPPAAVRDAVAEATHRVVCARLGAEAERACAWYAWVGAAVARALTGRRYTPCAGSLLVEVRPGAFFAFRAQHGQFHAWMMRWEPGRCELVDLSTRHFPAHAVRVGATWELPAPPAYLWTMLPTGEPLDPAPGRFSGFPGIVSYQVDAAMTAEFRRHWLGDPVRRVHLQRWADMAIREARTLMREGA